jgi:hypothetical protein
VAESQTHDRIGHSLALVAHIGIGSPVNHLTESDPLPAAKKPAQPVRIHGAAVEMVPLTALKRKKGA